MRYLLIFLLLPFSALCGHEYYLTVCAIFQNESRWLKEWVEFHRLVGVDHFVLYNHNSSDGWEEVLAEYIEQDLVEVVDFSEQEPWVVKTQPRAYDDAWRRFNGRTTWLAFIDIDEYLQPIEVDTLPEVLKDYEQYGGVVVNWRCFGTSGVETLEPGELLIEKLTWAAERTGYRSMTVKTIARPEHMLDGLGLDRTGVHRFEYLSEYFDVNTDHEHIEGDKRWSSERVCDNRLVLNHYFLRTLDWALGEKFDRAMKVFLRKPLDQHRWLLECEYYCHREEDLRIQRFVEPLRKRL